MIVINTLLSVGVLVLSGTLAVLHVASEVALGGQGGEVAIRTHVLVLLVLTVGLLASFNWFIGAYRETVCSDGEDDEDDEDDGDGDGGDDACSDDSDRNDQRPGEREEREERDDIGGLVRAKKKKERENEEKEKTR